MKKLIQVVGPSFTNYSLARVNRGLALALKEVATDYEVAIVSNQQFAERDPEKKDLQRFPEVAEILADKINPEAIVIFNNFPSDPNGAYGIENIKAELIILYIAWEESTFPSKWIAEFNQHAHLVACASRFVQGILRKSGLKVPTVVIPNAIDDQILNDRNKDKYKLQTKKKFKFLHVSSGYPRKGTDVLVQAYADEFTAADDVCLVLKSFPHALNAIPKWVTEAEQKDNAPEFELINQDISDAELSSLYNAVDAAVYPTRAEGFGLPIAESMLKKLPVISTNYGAHLDFANDENSFLIDYTLVDALQSQLVNNGAMWAEPDVVDLRRLMRHAYEKSDSTDISTKIDRAYQTAVGLTWHSSAMSFPELIANAQSLPEYRAQRRAVITEWNNQSGIADYADYLHTKIEKSFAETVYIANSDVPDLLTEDGENVKRLWTTGENTFSDTLTFLKKYKPDLVHIEYHSSKFKPEALARLVEGLLLLKAKIVVTLHSASVKESDIRKFSAMKKIHKILVHSQIELNTLQKAGFENVDYLPHGFEPAPKVDSQKLRRELGVENSPIIATHGLLTDKKGILQLIEATSKLKKDFPEILLILLNAVSVNNVSAQSFMEQCLNLIEKLKLTANVFFIPDFLERNQITSLLQLSDVNILAYDEIGEGASGAVQKLIAAGKPMILTASKNFADVAELATIIPNNSPAEIAKAIKTTLKSPISKSAEIAEYIEKYQWERVSLELLQKY